MKSITVYGLADPRDAHVKYVGQTYSLWARESQHITHATGKAGRRSAKDNWIRELDKEGLRPVMLILEVCNNKNGKETEQKWITEMGKRHRLFNVNDASSISKRSNVVVHILMGEGDRDAVHHAAFAKGQSMSAWMRHACLDAAAKQGAKDVD